MSQKIRSAVVVLIVSALFVSSAYALPPVPVAGGPRTGALLATAWSWLTSLVPLASPVHTPRLTATWEKAGSFVDPNGLTNNFSSNATTTSSRTIDPNGYK
jgi:hypothetical protein